MAESVSPGQDAAQELPPGVPASYAYPDVPVTRLLDDAAKDFPEADAVDAAGHRLTYRQVTDQVDRLATVLRGLGVGRGDRVGVLLPSCPHFLIALFACLRAEATAVLLDPEADDLEAGIDATGCRALVCLAAAYPRLAARKASLPTVRHVLCGGAEDYLPFPRNLLLPLVGRQDGRYRRVPREEGVLGFKQLIRRTAPEPMPVGTEVPAVVCDGFALGHRALVAGAFQLRLWVPDVQAGRERLLSAAAPSTPFGLAALLGLGVLSASTVVFPASAGPVSARAARRAAPTLLAAGPATLARLEPHAAALRALRVALADGPVDDSVSEAYHRATGARVRGGLAVPGSCGLAHADPVYGRAKAGSVGLALPDTRTAVLDDRGAPLPAGQVGAVAVRGPQVAAGSPVAPRHPVPPGREAATGREVARAQAVGEGAGQARRGEDTPVGWRRTGHRGHLDPEGYLWLEPSA